MLCKTLWKRKAMFFGLQVRRVPECGGGETVHGGRWWCSSTCTLHPSPPAAHRRWIIDKGNIAVSYFIFFLLEIIFLQILQIKSCLPILEYSFYNKNLRWSSYHLFCNFCCWHLFSNHCSRYQFGKFCSRQLFCMLIFWTALAKLAFQTTFLQRWLKGKCDQGVGLQGPRGSRGRPTGSQRVKG